MLSNKPYNERDDLEKIQSQWNKLSGLHTREEWSAAVVRAATAAEIAANFAIRKEFAAKSEFDSKFVDSLLRQANGLTGKMDRLLIPLNVGKKQLKTIKQIRVVANNINELRNGIVHRGEFCNEEEAKAAIQWSRQFVEELIHIYDSTFELKDKCVR